jgi:large subunit ribosomal protein L10
MKKISLIVKEASENRIKKSRTQASAFFLVRYTGLSSPDLTSLRQSLKTAKAELFVAKNSVARRALKDTGVDSIIKAIEGPCGLVFVKDEPIDATKVLCNFSKDHEKLQLAGGCLDDKILEKKDIEAIARLPGKDVLRAQVVMTLNSPISKFVMVLSGTLKKLVICLDQIKQKKQN